MGMSKRAVAFGLAAAVGVGGVVRCSTVMEEPEGRGVVDKALLGMAYSIQPVAKGLQSESGVTQAVFYKLARASTRKDTISKYLSIMFPDNLFLQREPETIEDYYRLAQAIKNGPDVHTHIDTDELRGLYLHVLAIGGDKYPDMTGIPSPEDGTKVLAKKVGDDVTNNYIRWFSSMISSPLQQGNVAQSKKENFLTFFVGHAVKNDAEVMTAYALPVSETQKNLTNRKIIEEYMLNKYYSNTMDTSRPKIGSLIAGLAASYDIDGYRAKVRQISLVSGMQLDCALKNLYVANLYDGAPSKADTVEEARKNVISYFAEASKGLKASGQSLGGEEALKGMDVSISYDIHVVDADKKRYGLFSFGCFLEK